MKNTLTENLERIHTTERGAERIRKNLGLKDPDPAAWCRTIILDRGSAAERRGKNWYVRTGDCEITINATSYTIITAHRNRKQGDSSARPAPGSCPDSATFRDYYYLKEELAAFCRENRLPASGSKQELTDRIACFLETGEAVKPAKRKTAARKRKPGELTRESIIETGFVCSEAHRAFFRKEIGKSFSFNVPFQNWLKSNAGKTYGDAVAAYHEIMAEKKKGRSPIGKQFEYNAYIRDFFADNPGSILEDAIRCWKYKKGLKGHNRYERPDLKALEME